MIVKNKWNGQTYEVWESSEKTVKLKKENGEIIEHGTHEELIYKKGYYYNTLNNSIKL